MKPINILKFKKNRVLVVVGGVFIGFGGYHIQPDVGVEILA